MNYLIPREKKCLAIRIPLYRLAKESRLFIKDARIFYDVMQNGDEDNNRAVQMRRGLQFRALEYNSYLGENIAMTLRFCINY